MSARPTATRWRSPPESCRGEVAGAAVQAQLAQQLVGTRAGVLPPAPPRGHELTHDEEVLRAVRNGTRLTVWNTKPTCSARKRVSSLAG